MFDADVASKATVWDSIGKEGKRGSTNA